MSENIKYFNRYSSNEEIEHVYGDALVKWLYASRSGKIFQKLLCKAPISQLYGLLQDSKQSSKKIDGFVKKFKINMNEFEIEKHDNPNHSYSTFNKFFSRKFKEGKRKFTNDPNQLGAFAEARYFGHNSINNNITIPVKGIFLNPFDLIKEHNTDGKLSNTFNEGPLLIARLCPVDYHRFHFPCDGKVIESNRVNGLLHSINPTALVQKNDIFITNERQVTVFDTPNFGKLAYIEVGAICVGKIVQTFKETSFKRGDEKGYFLFGGSTVILIGEKDAWKISPDISNNTIKGIETYIKLGDTIASKQ